MKIEIAKHPKENPERFGKGILFYKKGFQIGAGLISFNFWFWRGWNSNSLWWIRFRKCYFSKVTNINIRILWLYFQCDFGADVRSKQG